MSLQPDEFGALEDPLDQIVATCIESDPALLDSTVSKFCERYPEHARQIRARLDALRVVGLVRPPSEHGDERFPERLGEFRLLERLGGGGMGVVFRARQEPLGREVALKLIRPEHLYFPRARERFRRETGAVARLQHPGIVPIYSVGEDTGVPFFAMELVAGCTLGEVVARLRARAPETLTGRDLAEAIRNSLASWTRERASEHAASFERDYVTCVATLIASVADALAHAHSRDVLHRDVKPSNIAVTLDGRALLFDFGLASLVDRPAQFTASQAEIGSLFYMSPEHLRRDSSALDARADVYSLGVSLYELLTLQVPYFDPNADHTRRAILAGRADPIRARNRVVPRDLEVVCFKAMERDRERRYASAADFARDLRNVLEHRPIEARPPSAALRARRWMQRHPTASVTIGASLLLLTGGPSALLWQERTHAAKLQIALDDANAQRTIASNEAREAQRQRGIADAQTLAAEAEREVARNEAREASEISRFLRDLFARADPNNSLGSELTVREVLDYGAERLDGELADQPLVRASLHDSIGFSYLSLGEYESAETTLTRAQQLREEFGGVESLEVADSLSALAHLERMLSRPAALEHARRAAELRRKLSPAPDVETIRALNSYGLVLHELGRHDEAREIYGEALELADRLPEGGRRARGLVIGNLANTLMADERYEAAIEAANESIDIESELHGDRHPGVIFSQLTVANALRELKRFDEARELYERSLESWKNSYGEQSEPYAVLLNNLGALFADAGDRDEAQRQGEQALAIFESIAPPANANAIKCRQALALWYAADADWTRAQELFDELVKIHSDAELLATARGWLAQVWSAWCREALGDVAGAERIVERALEQTPTEADALDWTAVAHAQLARWLTARGELDRARAHAELALERREGDQMNSAADQWPTLAAGCVAQAAGDFALAQTEFAKLAELEVGATHAEWAPALARARLAALLAREEPARAEQLASRASTELTQRLGPDHPETHAARATLDALRAALVK